MCCYVTVAITVGDYSVMNGFSVRSFQLLLASLRPIFPLNNSICDSLSLARFTLLEIRYKKPLLTQEKLSESTPNPQIKRMTLFYSHYVYLKTTQDVNVKIMHIHYSCFCKKYESSIHS